MPRRRSVVDPQHQKTRRVAGLVLDTGLDGVPTGFERDPTSGMPGLTDLSEDDFEALLNSLEAGQADPG